MTLTKAKTTACMVLAEYRLDNGLDSQDINELIYAYKIGDVYYKHKCIGLKLDWLMCRDVLMNCDMI